MRDVEPFLYFELRPPAALQDHVQTYWGFDVRAHLPPVHTVWPDGCLSLLCRLTPGEATFAAFSGPRTTPLQVPVRSGECYRGVRLWPYAAEPLLGLSAPTLRDRRGLVAELLGPPPAATLQALTTPRDVWSAFERILLPLAATAGPPDPAVRAAIVAISDSDGACGIATLAAQVGLSDRQLRRRFRSATGLSPKEYARIRRLRSSTEARLRHGRGWSELAARYGYADQAHLVREYARLTGLTPTALERRLQLIEHRDVRP